MLIYCTAYTCNRVIDIITQAQSGFCGRFGYCNDLGVDVPINVPGEPTILRIRAIAY